MKKFYILMAALMTAVCVNAQALQFYVKGEPIENGARVDLTPYFEDGSWTPMYNPHLTMKTTTSGTASVVADFTKGECIPALDEDWKYGGSLSIQFCSIDGQCVLVNPGEKKDKQGAVTAGEDVDMQIELTAQIGDEQKYEDLGVDAEFTVTCNLGSESASVVFYVDKKGAGVNDIAVDANAPAEYFDLQGRRVANPENGIYIVRQGSKVTKQVIK